MSFRRGLKRSTPAKVAHRLGAAKALGLAGTPKGAGQLAPCARADQGETETCFAHSAVAADWCALMAAGQLPAFVGSPATVASCTYGMVRAAAVPEGATLPELTDTGAELQDVANALATYGLAPLGTQVPERQGFSDVPDDVEGEPFPEADVSQVQRAGSDIVSGEYSIPVDANAPTTVALCIDAGIPVWLGTLVGAAFQALGPTDIAQPTPTTDTTAGGHAMYISAYRTAADGSYEFRVENSWGTGWCDGGACWVSTAWLLACWELWPFAIKRAA